MSVFKRLLFLLLLVVLLLGAFAASVPLRFMVDNAVVALPKGISDLRGAIAKGSVRLDVATLPAARPIAASLPSIDIAWQWCPGIPDLAALCVQARSSAADVGLAGALAWSPFGATISAASLTGNIDNFPVKTSRASLPVSMQMKMSLDNARFASGALFPQDVRGRIALQKLTIAGYDLGDFNAALASDEQGRIGIRLQGKGELIRTVVGTAGVTAKGWDYDITVKTEDTIVRSFLERRGKPSAAGFQLTAKGNWQRQP